MLRIEGLRKQFYDLWALDGVSLHVPPGEVLVLLGPNGAGKTTLLKVLAGFLQADEGGMTWGSRPWPVIGYKPERLMFPERMRVRQYLRMIASLSDLPHNRMDYAVAEAISLVRLEEVADKRLGECSKGMRQRVGLAQALLGDPPLLLLDELTDGVDPTGQKMLEMVLRHLREMGKTIILSSHKLDEVVAVATKVVIMHHGRVVYQSSVAEALAERPQAIIHVDRDLTPMTGLLHALHTDLEVGERTLALRKDATLIRRQILSILLAGGYDILQIERRRASLAEIYAEVTR